MAQRKGYVYRQYIHSSASSSVKVPDSTWRRWLQQGRISENQLRELGIQPNRRRRVRRRRVVPNEEIQDHARLSPTHTAEDENFQAVNDVATSEANSTLAGAEQRITSADEDNIEPAGGAAPIQTHHSDVETAAVANFWSLSSFESEEEDLGEQHDQVTDETDLLLSVLDSANIGVKKLNEPLVPCLQVTKFETLLMILHLAMRHGYTDVLLEDLMYFVNELVGVKDAIPQSKFLFNKLFKFASHPDIHFFCSTCDIYLGMSTAFKKNVVCNNCAKTNLTSSLNGGDYFLSLSIRNQIKDILSRPHIKLVSRDNRADDMISDVADGLLYKSMTKSGTDLISPNALTISFNTDGSPVFKSGPNSLWPIQFYLNEVIPEQRFAAENILVAGLWFSRSKPKMEIFLRPFIQELRDLEKNGVVWKKPDGSVCESPIYAISCSVDSVAKPQIQNVIQFNGSFGCGYCLHPNRSVTVVEELDRRSGFFVSNNDSDSDGVEESVLQRRKKFLRYVVGESFPLRTDKQLRQHMMEAESTERVTFGAKGNSMLCSLKYFDIVHGFSVDHLHCVLLGVTRRLANLWFDSTSSREEYYIGRMIDVVDKRLADISPPSKMRYVRPISDRVHWKGNEWRGFLLYFGLPALINILPLVYVNHFQKLVTSIYILSKDQMSYGDVDDANRLLQDFVRQYQDLYGEVNMVYNVHLLTHLAKSVAKLGPLWTNSTFPFESGNGRLVKFSKGTRGVATQVAKKYLMMFSVPKLMRWDYKARDSVIDFCSNVMGYTYLKNSTSCNGVELLGVESYRELTDAQIAAFRDRNILTIPKLVCVFNRAIRKSTIYTGRLTSKQIKHDDSCVRLADGSFARIDLIMKLSLEGDENAWCICRLINIAVDAPNFLSPHIKQCSLEPFGSVRLLPFNCVEKKCILISCGDKKYVAEFPNNYEKD